MRDSAQPRSPSPRKSLPERRKVRRGVSRLQAAVAERRSMAAEGYSWRRLGTVLVEAGLLSEDDLAEVLVEQGRSGELLGQLLVARGFVSAAAVANALAEQHGGVLRSEHGFGTGLRESLNRSSREEGRSEPDAPPISAIAPPTERLASADEPDERDQLGPHLVFVPTSQGYLLLQRSGPAPAPGERLELSEQAGRQFIVTKVASSPLPADDRRCAYLQEP
jgi:hypothetical protein